MTSWTSHPFELCPHAFERRPHAVAVRPAPCPAEEQPVEADRQLVRQFERLGDLAPVAGRLDPSLVVTLGADVVALGAVVPAAKSAKEGSKQTTHAQNTALDTAYNSVSAVRTSAWLAKLASASEAMAAIGLPGRRAAGRADDGDGVDSIGGGGLSTAPPDSKRMSHATEPCKFKMQSLR